MTSTLKSSYVVCFKVKIIDPGDSHFLLDKNVERFEYEAENVRIRNENRKIEEENRKRAVQLEKSCFHYSVK